MPSKVDCASENKPAVPRRPTEELDTLRAISSPMKLDGHAPGHPGIAPTWTSSAKDMVGCTLGSSRVWFTLGFGIVNEVYYPRVDTPQTRDLGFIVADGRGFWVEVKRLENYTVRLLAPGTPAVEIRAGPGNLHRTISGVSA